MLGVMYLGRLEDGVMDGEDMYKRVYERDRYSLCIVMGWDRLMINEKRK